MADSPWRIVLHAGVTVDRASLGSLQLYGGLHAGHDVDHLRATSSFWFGGGIGWTPS